MNRMNQLAILIGLHVTLLSGIPPIIIVVGKFSFVPQLVDSEFLSIGVHVSNHGGGVDIRLENGVDCHSVVE